MSRSADVWYVAGNTAPAMGVLGSTPVLILAECVNRKYRAIARLGSFEIVQWRANDRISFRKGRNVVAPFYSWTLIRKIARRRVHRGKAGYAKLADFTFEEHQAVLSVFKRMLYAERLVNDRHKLRERLK